ncbi:MAG: hypothetical protein WCI12_03475 [Actinomycetes bacterium]
MAIAPLPEQQEFSLFEVPWPEPALHLVNPAQPVSTSGASIVELFPFQSAPRRTSVASPLAPVTNRSIYRRRRLFAIVVLVVVVLSLLLPMRMLGATTISGVATPGGTPAGLSDGSLYIVHEGDTIDSIATAINPSGDHSALVAKLRAEVGSDTVVPGEHILLP